jgi:hypothetical protein
VFIGVFGGGGADACNVASYLGKHVSQHCVPLEAVLL